jgi:hypothetical protein
VRTRVEPSRFIAGRGWRATRAATALAAAVILAGACAGPATPSSPTVSVSPSPAPTGRSAALADPPLQLRLPVGWDERSVSTIRTYVEQLQSSAPNSVQFLQPAVEMLANGTFRFLASGPTDVAGVTATVIILVEDRHETVDAAVERMVAQAGLVAKSQRFARDPIATRLGDGVLVTADLDVPPGITGVPSTNLTLVVVLADGRTFLLQGSAPQASKTFDGLVRGVIDSIEPL